ncbi:HECT-type E3 ubiquitin transferase, partial [Sarracenia purpurea var. burkii]
VLRDDSLPLCMPEGVHDVKLGDPAESPVALTTNSSKFRSWNSFVSRDAMSFAAGSMAGLASANSRGISGGRDGQGRPLFGSNDPPRLIFSAGGKHLNRNLTIYQAVQHPLLLDEDDERYTGDDFVPSDRSRLWSDLYTITYERADNQTDTGSAGVLNSTTTFKFTKAGSMSNSDIDSSLQRVSLPGSILHGELPCDLGKNNSNYDILSLLRVLEGLNQLAPRLRVQAVTDSYAEGRISDLDELSATGIRISPEEFINSKLTPKLARQIQDAHALCSGSLPLWCYQLMKACPFLFPFETQRQYFYSTPFGLSRALYRLQQQQGADGQGSISEREARVGRLHRHKVCLSCNRILESAVEVMETYSSQNVVLEVEYFGEVGTGLGPTLEFYTLLSRDLQKVGLGMWRSISSSNKTLMKVDGYEQKNRKIKNITVLGSAGDSDLIQAPFGLFPQPWPPNADASDGSQFSKVVAYFRLVGRVMAKALQDGRILNLPMSTAFYKLMLGQELDLHDILSFNAELGRSLQEFQALVDIHSLDKYISSVVDATVRIGIASQMEAFRAGFNQAETLVDHIKFDHGYTAKSPAIVNLLEIMGEFTPEQQRAFCQFVTGAPQLPPGGLAVLNPKLTIVRKEIMWKKLLFAISEGQGSFDFS